MLGSTLLVVAVVLTVEGHHELVKLCNRGVADILLADAPDTRVIFRLRWVKTASVALARTNPKPSSWTGSAVSVAEDRTAFLTSCFGALP